MAKESSEIVLGKIVEKRIFLIRGHRVMLDSDLADLYQVQTRNLNKAVKRNLDRFPSDFMFQLTNQEVIALMFQFGTSNRVGRGGLAREAILRAKQVR
jgi:hypothetical protein